MVKIQMKLFIKLLLYEAEKTNAQIFCVLVLLSQPWKIQISFSLRFCEIWNLATFMQKQKGTQEICKLGSQT